LPEASIPSVAMNASKLNKFSRYVYRRLCDAYPSWINKIRNDPEHEGTLILRVPSPGSAQHELIVDTLDGEITVYFGYYHEHFGWSDVPDPDAEAFSNARDAIDAIVEEKLLFAWIVNDGTWEGTETLAPSEIDSFKAKHTRYKSIVGWSRSY
jgi:hypothetical protein